MRRLAVVCTLVAFLLAGCDGWPMGPIEYNPAPLVPSSTPVIQSVTPFVVSPSPAVITPTEATATDTPTSSTEMPPEATLTPTLTEVPSATPGKLGVDILGCDTSIDITHGMGEVTNAYVTISNTTGSDLSDICATLNALDEGRPHPDKTKCLPSLPNGYQVTLKLTVDTTYQQATPIQIDVMTGGNLLSRVGEPACKDIGLFPPDDTALGTVTPVP